MIVGIILAFYYYIYRPQTPDPAVVVTDQPVEEVLPPSPQPPVIPDQTFEVLSEDIVEEGEIDDAVIIERNAIVFAEKYGSHSNQSSFNGIRDLVDLSTKALEPWLITYIEQLQQKYPNPETYMGVNTEALSVKFISLERNSSIVNVATQRETFEGSIEKPFISQQDLRLEFEKVGSNWLVSAAYWQ